MRAAGEVEYEYLSCAVNRTTHVADWLTVRNDEQCADVYVFGVHKGFAAVTAPQDLHSCAGHREGWGAPADVYVLKAAPAHDTHAALIVGHYNGALHVFQPKLRDGQVAWTHDVQLPQAHASSVTALGVLRDPASVARGADLFVSGSTDGTLKVWHLARGPCMQATLVQDIALGGKYPLDIALVHLPDAGAEPVTLMAVALTDKKVHVYVREAGTFTLRLALEGHEDWVRALDFAVAPRGQDVVLDVHLASASQDNNLRLWRIQAASAADVPDTDTTDAFEAMARELIPSTDQAINTKKNWLTLHDAQRWAISLDALLVGHNAWATGVRWLPALDADAQQAALLSSSMDNSMIVWSPREPETSTYPRLADDASSQALWLPVARLGDVGTLSGGFLSALWHPAGNAVLTHDRHGATHLWVQDASTGRYAPCAVVSGHAGAARGVAWEPYGDYFLSTGVDRTTRLHGTYCTRGDDEDALPPRSWHEMARPQTHGYDLQAVAWLDRAAFVSAADEKVMRVFGAPRNFVESARALHMVQEHVHATHVVVHDAGAPDAWQHPMRLDGAIEAALADGPRALAVLVFSDELAGEAPAVSLHAVEYFLQQVYTKAWGIAARRDRLRTDITVYLVPSALSHAAGHTAAEQWANTYGRAVTAVWAVGDAAQVDWLAPVLRARPIPVPTSESTPGDAQGTSFPRAATVALGGTFDHLHIGHKLLLSIAALCTTRRLIVGVTSTELLAKKKHRAYVEPIAVRLAAVRHFLRAFRQAFGALELDVVPISDVCGPAATDPTLDLLVVTEETAKGANTIAEERRKNQVQAVDVHVVSLVDAADHSDKVGSTAIRGWLEAKQIPPGHETPLDVDLAAALAAAPASVDVPALGLSNRAADAVEADTAPASTPVLSTPPNPEQLQAATLWLELEKLYGHGYELLSVDADPRTRLIASTCKATTPAHAVVRLFDGRERYKPLAKVLEGHTLSVTRVRFSPLGEYLLTSSRDRSWRLFRRAGSRYEPYAGERAHARIVWDCAWSVDGRTFATASRDKTVKVWQLDAASAKRYAPLATIGLEDAATAVAMGDGDVLAIGLECGEVRIYEPDATRTHWTCAATLPWHHTGTVHQLAFRPRGAWQDTYNQVPYMLLSAGEDGCVRVISWHS